jgi:hypothetical protein
MEWRRLVSEKAGGREAGEKETGKEKIIEYKIG